MREADEDEEACFRLLMIESILVTRTFIVGTSSDISFWHFGHAPLVLKIATMRRRRLKLSRTLLLNLVDPLYEIIKKYMY